MKLTLELNLHDQPNPDHFQNFLGYARLLDRDAVNGLSGVVPKGLPTNPVAIDDDDDGPDEAETQHVASSPATGRGRGRPRKGATAEQAAAAVSSSGNGALPPGVETGLSVADIIEAERVEAEPVLSNGSLPPGVSAPTLPVAVAEPAADAGSSRVQDAVASPPVTPSAPQVQDAVASPLPPGVAVAMPTAAAPQAPAMPPAPQVPAMPHVPPAVASDGITIADVQASYAACAKTSGPKAFGLLKSETWPDGSPKPRWLNANQIPPEHFERMIMELSAL